MAGFKLKEMLTHQKQIEKEERKREAKKAQQEEGLKKLNDGPTVVSHDDAVKQNQEAEKSEGVVEKPEEEYQSQALSRKERRKLKKLQKKSAPGEDEEEEDEEDKGESSKRLDLEKLEMSDPEDEEDEELQEEKDEEDEEEEKEEDVPLSDVEFDSDADVVPYQKVTINNANALKHALERIQLPWAKHSFEEHMSVTSEANTDEAIKDIYDDTERELAFYKQSLDTVIVARQKLKSLKVPFKRPLDYFAEMVKSDEHMDKLKSKLACQ